MTSVQRDQPTLLPQTQRPMGGLGVPWDPSALGAAMRGCTVCRELQNNIKTKRRTVCFSFLPRAGNLNRSGHGELPPAKGDGIAPPPWFATAQRAGERVRCQQRPGGGPSPSGLALPAALWPSLQTPFGSRFVEPPSQGGRPFPSEAGLPGRKGPCPTEDCVGPIRWGMETGRITSGQD